MSRAEILKAALELPDEEREKLVHELKDSLQGGASDGDLSPAWEDEISRRLHKIERGEAEYAPADEVFQEAHEIVRGRR